MQKIMIALQAIRLTLEGRFEIFSSQGGKRIRPNSDKSVSLYRSVREIISGLTNNCPYNDHHNDTLLEIMSLTVTVPEMHYRTVLRSCRNIYTVRACSSSKYSCSGRYYRFKITSEYATKTANTKYHRTTLIIATFDGLPPIYLIHTYTVIW